MTRLTLACLLLLITLGPELAIGAEPAPPPPKRENVSSADPRTPEDERKGFHLPEGFEIELVAAEPEIHKPLNLAFDDRGRLWVTETLEYPYPAAEGTTPRDGVKILEDFAPDGRARSIRTFADGLNIPIGVLPMPGGNAALVHSIPNILRVSDDDGDGRAERREVLYATFGANDTHGMTNAFTWGFDGWIYACHGFSNTSTVEGADHAAITMQSGHVYRMRPDGSHLEIFTHGQVNPFGLAFDPLGNLYSCDCHSKPLYQLLRGAWYPSFGKPHDGLGFGPAMMTHDHGSTAISGISVYPAEGFPESYRGTAFVGNVMTNRINHDRLEWHGTTPKAIPLPDFLWSEDNWFRPVDIELGPDGALYVADFYNRIIGHYEVPLTHPGRDRERGRIWRIVYRGPEGEHKPDAARGDWTKATRAELIDDLGHPNLTVRTLAANQLAARNADPALRKVATEDEDRWRRVHALWVLQRQGLLDEATLKAAADDREAAVRAHAQRVLGERPELSGELRALALRGLGDSDALVRRCAAEALGRHPDPGQVRPLLDLLQATDPDDTHLIHVTRMALRDQLRADSAWTDLETTLRSDRDRRDLTEVAVGVPTAAAARFLLGRLGHESAPRELQVAFVHHIARYGDGTSEDDLRSFVDRQHKAGLTRQAELLTALQQGIQERGAKPGESAHGLALEVGRTLLDSRKPGEVKAGIQLASTFALKELQDRLAGLAWGEKADEATRTAALKALPMISVPAALPLLSQILSDPSIPVALREQSAGALGGIAEPGAQEALLSALAAAPARLQAAIAAALAVRAEGADALLDALAAGKASARLLQEPRIAVVLRRSELPNVKERSEALLKGMPPNDVRLRALLNQRRKQFDAGAKDPEHGAKIFEKNCMPCHQFQGNGARIGPQLDGIGARGVERLLEDILDPNRNVDQAFRTTHLALSDGRIVDGLLLREEGQVLILADSQGKEVRVPRDTVDERSSSQLSPMPANFADEIGEPDLVDLLSYLLSSPTPD